MLLFSTTAYIVYPYVADIFKVLPISCQTVPLYLNTKWSDWPETYVNVGAVLPANSNTVLKAIVWVPPYWIFKLINEPVVELLGAEKVVFSVVVCFAFGDAWLSHATAFDEEVILASG